MKTNEDLKLAYKQIKSIYEKMNKEPGVLEKFTFCNKWNIAYTSDNYVGIAFNFTGEHAVYGDYVDYNELEKIQSYIGKNLFEIIEHLLAYSGIQARSNCLAMLNALSQAISSQEQLKERGIQLVDPNEFSFVDKNDIVTVIGYGGVINKLYGKCKELHVIDMRPKSSLQTLIIGKDVEYAPKDITFHTVREDKEITQNSDIVIMSGCTLINGTFREIIENSKKAKIIGMFGPSGQIIPEYLFDNGINYIISSRVTQPEKLFNHLRNPFYGGGMIHEYMESYAIKSDDIS
ncbi:hypothetical protein DUF364 [Gottschalkia acidurici 9a]|uniref:Heavy-metal chelation domain-containing protein n=1 Tax=Gottschalkia acidurici (strain ATCC 7906 / DSM 604 / BCRC 14475 / CIP 104303 / KCTC 5404 / NCIMB 10678 / 9a) TaxID=1128398 RepID=K0B2U8_GOTA9|nr:DUF364 domain-containing protein [Gottschalkia acidurici]AFS78926.1 hypothetical protein DUF364 [Gottschalkia acidurici 9a]